MDAQTTAQMNAVVTRAAGGPEMLTCVSRPRPIPAAGQVLVRTRWAGVNPHDCNQRRRGTGPAGETDVLGLEIAGDIVALGAGVAAWRLGERVCALVPGGGYAEYCLADAALALALPEHIDTRTGAALPEAAFTAWLNLIELGRLAPGETLLVHGGSGNVGAAAIQIARLRGARVIALAGSAERMRISCELGAHAAINYREPELARQVLALTDGRGADVILDSTAAYASENLQSLAQDGRILHLSSGGEGGFCPPLRLLMQRRATLTGALLRALPLARKQAVARALLGELWPHLGHGYRPPLDRDFALAEAAAAHAHAESGQAIGKITLQISPD